MLILHGMIDENVHFRHSAMLVASLCAVGKKSGVRGRAAGGLVTPRDRSGWWQTPSFGVRAVTGTHSFGVLAEEGMNSFGELTV